MQRVVAVVAVATLAIGSAFPADATSSGTDAPSPVVRGDGGPSMIELEAVEQAYIAGYPLVVSVRTLQRFAGLIGVNTLFWQQALSGPEARFIVAPNRDTLYSIAVLDLRSEPTVLTLPEINDRYYTYQFLDAWTESFAYLGTRATGGRAGTWVVTPPGWDGELPDGAEQIEATTPLVFLLGRFLVDDVADVANVTAISERVHLEPLSAVTGATAPPTPPPLGEPRGTPQDIAADATFFDELGEALAINPFPTPVQEDLFAYVEPFGIGAGQHPTELDQGQRALLDAGAAHGYAEIVGAASMAEPVDGWTVNLDIGRYGDDLLQRAVVARVGWGANVPEEAVYAIARTDADDTLLDGANTYRITFPAGRLPPVDAFWSLSVYGTDMFYAEHPSGVYTIGDRTEGLVIGDDGSLEIILSTSRPDGSPTNWLPVPTGGFVLMLRLYLPRQAVVDGDYQYPAIERLDQPSGIA